MAVNVSDVRSELQLPIGQITDADIAYAIDRVELDDINLVCAHVLRMLKNKYRGRIRYRIGRYVETISTAEVDKMIRMYMTKSTLTKVDGGVDVTDTDSIFDEDSI